MSKDSLHYLFKRQFIDLLAVCELPLNEPCNGNKTRMGCVQQDCCFFMDACYQKTVPGRLIVFYCLIAVQIIIFLGLVGFWFYKYRKQKKKLADMEMENGPAEIDTNCKTQEKDQAETIQVEECNDDTGPTYITQEKEDQAETIEVEESSDESDTSSITQEDQDCTSQVEEFNEKTAIVTASSTSEMEKKHENVKAAENKSGQIESLNKAKN